MLADARTRRFTAEEILRMVDAGILSEDEPVELIGGELIVVSPQGPRHRALSVRLHQQLERAFGPGFHVQDHSPIDGGPHDMPEPDVAVVRGEVDDFLDHHPTGDDLAVVVEISVTSQALDRAKAAVYARGGVPLYWQLDVPARRLIVYSEPRDGEYRATRVFVEADDVVIGSTALRVGALLPPG